MIDPPRLYAAIEIAIASPFRRMNQLFTTAMVDPEKVALNASDMIPR